MTNQKNQKTLYQISNEELTKLMDNSKNSKLMAQELSTGISYFEGKTRLCKILKTKKSAKIEINILLDSKTEQAFGLNKISAAEAYKKHLGTMKYMATVNSETELKKLIKIIFMEFENQKTKNSELSK